MFEKSIGIQQTKQTGYFCIRKLLKMYYTQWNKSAKHFDHQEESFYCTGSKDSRIAIYFKTDATFKNRIYFTNTHSGMQIIPVLKADKLTLVSNIVLQFALSFIGIVTDW